MKKRKTFVLTVIAAGAIMLIISWFAGRIISKKYYFSHNNTYNEEGMMIDSVNHPYYSKGGTFIKYHGLSGITQI